MKRYSLVFAVLGLLLLLGSIACANFPSLNPSDTTVTVYLKQGYYDDALVWFFCTDTDDINFASDFTFPYRIPTLATPLLSVYDPSLDPAVGSKMFINVSKQQGPIFNAVPTQAAYSGIWSVVFIRFLPGQARTVTNLSPYNAITNPNGFPDVIPGPNQQAELLTKYGSSSSSVVLDCPIAAVGPFDGGAWERDNSDPTTLYRLPQVITFNRYYKSITLPAWYAYCQERLPGDPPGPGTSYYIDKVTFIVPDVADPILADRLKANLAPALGLIDPLNVQVFYFVDGRVFGEIVPTPFIGGGPTGILAAMNQYPVIQWCPNGIGAYNGNRAYTPVMDFWILEAGPNFPYTPADRKLAFANNAPYIENVLLPGTIYLPLPDGRINAPVMGGYRILRQSGGCPDCP